MRMGDRALTEMAGRRAVTQVERAKVVEIEMLLRNARLQWRARQQLLIYKVREDALVARTVGIWAFGGEMIAFREGNPRWKCLYTRSQWKRMSPRCAHCRNYWIKASNTRRQRELMPTRC